MVVYWVLALLTYNGTGLGDHQSGLSSRFPTKEACIRAQALATAESPSLGHTRGWFCFPKIKSEY